MYLKYKAQPFMILGFPCNQFGHQEPGSEEEISQFCSRTYNVSFPIHHKVDVNGDAAHPALQVPQVPEPRPLRHRVHQGARPSPLARLSLTLRFLVQWNFTKFLVDKEGKVVKRYSHGDTPEAIEKDVAALLTNGKL